MKLFSITAISFLMLFSSCMTAEKKEENSNSPKAPEEAAINKAVADAYQAICFKPGQQPDYEGIKKYFIPQATLINFGSDSMEVMRIDQFVDFYKAFIDSNKVSLFYEEEIAGTTDQFGRIAQRMSSYNTYMNTMDSVAQRGVNSFQTVKTPEGWRVSSIIWDIESPALKIPDEYLKANILK